MLGKPGVAQDKPLSFFLLSRRKPSLPTTLEPTCLTFFSNSHLTIASITLLRPVVCPSLKHSKALFFFSLTFFLASYPPDFLKTDSKINKGTASMETPDFEGASGEGRGWWWGGSTQGVLEPVIQLIYKLFAANGHKWGAEAGNKILGLENGVISLRLHWKRKRLYTYCWLSHQWFLSLWNSCCTWGVRLSVGATVDRNIPFGPYSGNKYYLVLVMLLFVCVCTSWQLDSFLGAKLPSFFLNMLYLDKAE